MTVDTAETLAKIASLAIGCLYGLLLYIASRSGRTPDEFGRIRQGVQYKVPPAIVESPPLKVDTADGKGAVWYDAEINRRTGRYYEE